MIASRITKIEFDNPIDIYEGDTLNITFFFRPQGSNELQCKVVLNTADGEEKIIGEDVEDIIDE